MLKRRQMRPLKSAMSRDVGSLVGSLGEPFCDRVLDLVASVALPWRNLSGSFTKRVWQP